VTGKAARTVYLAGPAVFHPAARALFDYLKEVCATHGLTGIAPSDGLDSLDSLPKDQQAAFIRAANVEKIKACDVVVVCISPFRGAGADAGSAWEMGYAEALGKPVVAWCEDMRPYVERVPHQRDDDGRVFCQQHGMLVEDFGLVDNLMMTAGPIPVQGDFEAAVRLAASLP
jgi:nucleoside 2-deoxyribosyltransferase